MWVCADGWVCVDVEGWMCVDGYVCARVSLCVCVHTCMKGFMCVCGYGFVSVHMHVCVPRCYIETDEIRALNPNTKSRIVRCIETA